MITCTRCGGPVDDWGVVADDYAYCSTCEDQYQAGLRAEYPHGQCQECGAAYRTAVCELGKTHTWALHVEGACGQWSDAEPVTDEAIGYGYCSLGCTPQGRWPVELTEADLIDLPF